MAKRDSERVIHSSRQFEALMFPRAARERREEVNLSSPRVAGEERAAEELQHVRIAIPPLRSRSKPRR